MVRRHLLVCVALAVTGAAVPVALAARQDPAAPAGAAAHPFAVATSLPGLTHDDPVRDAIRAAHPKPGTVVPVTGPFDDRLMITDLRLRGGIVTGQLAVTSDVSDIIDLQVLVGFYDARGVLLRTAVFEQHGEQAHDGPPSETVEFTVRGPVDAVAAGVGVPVLVNE